MIEGESYLGITQADIDTTHERVSSFVEGEGLPHYIHETDLQLAREQPLLHAHIHMKNPGIYIPDAFTFKFGSAVTYDMLPETERRKPLTSDEISASHRSILERRKTPDPRSPIDLSWYFQILHTDSPEFYQWAAEIIGDFENTDAQMSFLIGVTRVSLPFYMRAEAKRLRETFS